MNVEKNKFFKFIKDGNARMFLHELESGYKWRRTIKGKKDVDLALETLGAEVAKVFDFAHKHERSYINSLKSAFCPFLCPYTGYQDELLRGAAIWLYKATKNAEYLNYIQRNNRSLGAVESDDIFGSSKQLVYCGGVTVTPRHIRAIEKRQVGVDVENKSKSANSVNTCAYGACGWGNKTAEYLNYIQGNSQSLGTTFNEKANAKYLSYSRLLVSCGAMTLTPRTIRAVEKCQVDCILGSNPLEMSYMVGYGSKYPQLIHHSCSTPRGHTF
ncbi:endoglucanase 3-like [Cryptomeria japonica]|uniref:endoglucanase 3-like n=1 Tax=Cryptomeria japonica TaxID=3369 RepID=UPI0027DA0DDB|nr:endoglucanase 3-like [Cryptomeria japonica]